MPIFFDTHAHLDYPDYAGDLPEVVARAQAAGIVKIISIGTSLSSSERAIRLAEKFSNVFAAVGWHPTEAEKAPNDLRPALREFAKHPKVVAIGEAGLDYHHLPALTRPPATLSHRMGEGQGEGHAHYKKRQAEIFRQQLEVAAEFNAPVVPMKSYFEAASPHGLIGYNLMLEHLHPNVDGQFIMSQAFFDTLHQHGMIAPQWNEALIKPATYYREHWPVTELDSTCCNFQVQPPQPQT